MKYWIETEERSIPFINTPWIWVVYNSTFHTYKEYGIKVCIELKELELYEA